MFVLAWCKSSPTCTVICFAAASTEAGERSNTAAPMLPLAFDAGNHGSAFVAQ